jgi:hypothetical protein
LLALSQAGAYLAETGLSEARYLELLQERASEVLVRARPSTYPMLLAASWTLALDQLSADPPLAAVSSSNTVSVTPLVFTFSNT